MSFSLCFVFAFVPVCPPVGNDVIVGDVITLFVARDFAIVLLTVTVPAFYFVQFFFCLRCL